MSHRLWLAMLLLPAPAVSQDRPWSTEHLSTRISREDLDAISARGREIAGYDAAAWHATDAVQALGPVPDYIASGDLLLSHRHRRPDHGL